MKKPTASEIAPYPDNLDQQAALNRFLGASIDDAETLFREKGFSAREDLMFMGIEAFHAYLPAAVSYVCSDAAQGDADAVSGLLNLLFFRSDEPGIQTSTAEVCRFVDHVLTHLDKFGLDESVYGDVPAKAKALESTYLRLSLGRDTR